MKVKVVIVDDSPAIRERLALMIDRMHGLEVAGNAGSAGEGVDVIRQSDPDVVILDVHMPGGSGFELLQEIKKNSHAPVVIMLTNYPNEGNREKCRKLRGDFFFDKSTEFDQALAVLAGLAARPTTGSED